MNDYQRVVDDLRSFLQATDQTCTDTLRAQADQYAKACQDVNARLRRCEDYLKKGLRAEAIHLAQAEPVLLDLLAVLDFPERDKWEELAALYGLPSPPRFNLATAEALNQAYAEAEPLENFLRKHRLLALARAPLPERLKVIRKLAELDPANAVWGEDVITFEKARFQELLVAAEAAAPANDLDTLRQLHEELNATPWAVPPPAALVRKIDGALTQVRQVQARKQLRKLEAELNDAFAGFDVAAGMRLRAQWQDLARVAALDVDDPLWERVGPALDWLAEEDRRLAEEKAFQTAVADLDRALEGPITVPELRRLVERVVNQGRPMPPDLDHRWRERLNWLRQAERNKKLLIAGAVLMGIALFGGIGVALVLHGRHVQKVEAAAHDLQELVAKGQLAEAQKLLDDLDDGVATDPLVEEQAQTLKAAQEKHQAQLARDRQRAQDFATALQAGQFDQADALARTDEERAKARDRRAQAQADRDRDFRARADKIEAALEALEKGQGGSLTEVDRQLAQLDGDRSGISDAEKEHVRKLRGRLTLVRKRQADNEKRAQADARLTAAVGATVNVKAFSDGLHAYAREFPGTDRARDFQQALAEKRHWQAALDWQVIAGDQDVRDLRLTAGEAKARGDRLRQLLAANPTFADQATAKDLQEWLDALGDRDAAGRELSTKLNHWLYKDLWMVTTRDKDTKEEKNYYFRADPEKELAEARKTGTFAKLRFVATFDGDEKPKNLDADKVVWQGKAPQAVGDAWSKAAAKEWDEKIVHLANAILKAEHIDPVPQFELLQKVIEVGRRGSPGLRQGLAVHAQALQEAKLGLPVPWMNPDLSFMTVQAVIAVRRQAATVIKALPPLEPALEPGAKLRKDLQARLAQTPQAVGWLARDAEGEWKCSGAGVQDLRGRKALCVLVPDPDQAHWVNLEANADGRPRPTGGNNRAFVEGRLVFARPAGP